MSSELTSPSTAVSFLLKQFLTPFLTQKSLESHFNSCENRKSYKSSFRDLTQLKVSILLINLKTKKIH